MTPVTISAGDLTVTVLTWGAAVRAVHLRDVAHNLTCTPDDPADYLTDCPYHGTLIGPIANRISNARVKIGGMMHELERNQDGLIHLHSGKGGTHLQDWSIIDQSAETVTLALRLPDGMCGLPGNRMIHAAYRVTAPATLTLTIDGTTDDPTIMNFANHSYWNLDGGTTWDSHILQIDADSYLPINADGTPTGDVVPVDDTAFDFRAGGRALSTQTDVFDNNLCLSKVRMAQRDVATLTGRNGLRMTMATTEPGLQIYDGRDVPNPRHGIAIEAQGWPDAPNHRGFPSIKVTPDAPYQQTTSWKFNR
ncbi:MAG: galactose mutarotase [Yoonia sp.]|nr:galactose mutarotase [Yoonia sp.]